MTNFNELKKAVVSVHSRWVKTHKSLKAIMEAVDFNVFRFRAKTGTTILGKRGWQDEQRQLQDCTIVNMPDWYKLYALNIPQFLAKMNWDYPEYKEGPNWVKQLANIKSKSDFKWNEWKDVLQKMPNEVQTDIWLSSKLDWTGLSAKKEWYIAWIEQNGTIIPLRRKQFDEITIKWSTSKKTIYRDKRDWNLEDSFIKQVWLLIASTVVDKDWKSILELDIDPKNYVPKKENSENTKIGENINTDDTSVFDNDFEESQFEIASEVFDNLDKKKFYECEDCGEIFRETEWHVDKDDKLVCQNCGSESIKERKPTAVTFWNSILRIKGVFDSSDIDSANEYAKEKNIVVTYDWKKWEFTFTWEVSVLKEIEELFADQSVELTWE